MDTGASRAFSVSVFALFQLALKQIYCTTTASSILSCAFAPRVFQTSGLSLVLIFCTTGPPPWDHVWSHQGLLTQHRHLLLQQLAGSWAAARGAPAARPSLSRCCHGEMPAELAEAPGQRGGQAEPTCALLHPLHRHLPNNPYCAGPKCPEMENLGHVKVKGLVFFSSGRRQTFGNRCEYV